MIRIRDYSRYELKYLVDTEQRELLTAVLAAYLDPDRYGDNRGRYTITSLYYDSMDYKAYWDKINGHRFRRKVRIRIYRDQLVTAETPCFVEIKQRINKTVQKKRVILPYSSAAALCGTGTDMEQDEMPETERMIIDEVKFLHSTWQLQPACVVSYDRLAFEGSEYDPGLRVTFDTNLKCRTHDLTLLSQSSTDSHYFVPPQWCIMEIKVNYRIPYWLTELIGRYQCTLRRISKYCLALEESKALLQQQQVFY